MEADVDGKVSDGVRGVMKERGGKLSPSNLAGRGRFCWREGAAMLNDFVRKCSDFKRRLKGA